MKTLLMASTLLIAQTVFASGTDTKPSCAFDVELCNVQSMQAFRVQNSETVMASMKGDVAIFESGTDTRQARIANSGTDTIYIKSLKFLAESESSVYFQVNDSKQVFEIYDDQLGNKPVFFNYLNESFKTKSWTQVE